MLSIILILIAYHVEPMHLSERIDQITVRIANLYRTGRIDGTTYTILFDARTRAHKAALRWIHGGPAYEQQAKEVMETLEGFGL